MYCIIDIVYLIVHACKKNDEDIEDLDEDVYCSIAVTKYACTLGST